MLHLNRGRTIKTRLKSYFTKLGSYFHCTVLAYTKHIQTIQIPYKSGKVLLDNSEFSMKIYLPKIQPYYIITINF